MKTIITSILLSIMLSYAQAKKSNVSCAGSGNSSNITLQFTSTEINSITGTFTLQIVAHAQDTAYLIPLDLNGYNLFNATVTVPWNKTTLYANDSAVATIQATYNTTQLPYYTSIVRVTGYSFDADSALGKTATDVIVFFTPYNTTELWNRYDYEMLPRLWKQPNNDSIQPPRVYIAKDSIPISTRLPVQSNLRTTYEINNEYSVTLPNLPYYVIQRAYTQAQIDSVDALDNTTGTNSKLSTKNYYGSVTGRIYTSITNDDKNEEWIGLSGLHIKLFWRTPAHWNEVIADGITGLDGVYTLNYNFNFKGTANTKDLYLRVISEDFGQYNISVGSFLNEDYSTIAFIKGLSQGDNSLENFSMYIGNTDRSAYLTAHYMHNAYRFVRNSYSAAEMPNGLNVKIYNDYNPKESSHYNPLLYGTPRIYLEHDDAERESVCYHEFGHHVMYSLQGGYPITGAVGSHPWELAHTPREVWAEAWGYAFAQMCDLHYNLEDHEYDWIQSVPSKLVNGKIIGKDESGEYRNPFKYTLQNGFRSEYNIACALYDLYDGADKFSYYVAPKFYDDNNVDYPYALVPAANTSDRIKSGYKKGKDYVSLSFRQIADFFIHIKSLNSNLPLERATVYKFYQWLVGQHSGCELDDIATVFRENRVTQDISDAGYEHTQLEGNPINTPNTTNDYFSELRTVIGFATPIFVVDNVYYGKFVNSACCIYDYLINNSNITGSNLSTYKAYNNVIVNSVQGSTVKCIAASNVEFVAGHEVAMLNGFAAEEGSSFAAYIDPCPGLPPSHRLMNPNSGNNNQSLVGETLPQEQPLKPIATKVNNKTEEQLITLYPNPTTGTLSLAGLAYSGYTYKLINATGAIVQEGSFNNDVATINLPTNASNGLYNLLLYNTTTGAMYTKNIVLER
jgi:hypothetical protein